jgi:exopolysaccharide biosynthesis polyprenyl glycosylphosphotransferase
MRTLRRSAAPSFLRVVDPNVGHVRPRPARRLIGSVRFIADVGAILCGLLTAEEAQRRMAAEGLALPLGHVELFTLFTMLAWLAVGALFGLYDTRRLASAFDELKLVLQTSAVGSIAGTMAAFLLKVPTQRSWALIAWTTCSCAMLIARLLQRLLLRRLRLGGRLISNMLIVGAGGEGRDLYDTITRHMPGLGYRVIGFLDDDRGLGPSSPGYPDVLGGTGTIARLVAEMGVDAVLISGSIGRPTAERLYRALRDVPVDVHLASGLPGVAATRVAVHRFGELPVIGVRRVDLTGPQQTLKRLFDLFAASFAILALSPVLLACAVAVRLSGPGPILFTQQRVGRDGREFTIHKFRSMVADAEARLEQLLGLNEADGLLFKLDADPRVTKVGKFMRAWSLDELPQLFDVIRGDMSLVGPRPPLPSEVASYDDWLRNRLRVKPGLTGLWQVSGRHRTTFADYVRHDLYYVENWSLALDLFIVLRTIPAVLARSGA